MTTHCSFRRLFLALLGCCLTGFVLSPVSAADKEQPKSVEVTVQDIVLTVPASWKQNPPSNRLRLAEFVIPAVEGDEEPAELVISSFGGGGGGTDANISRWLAQFQEKDRKAKILAGTSPQGSYVIADITGTYNKPDGPPVLQKTKPTPGSQMLGVILTVEKKGNYFLKLTGPEKTVTAAAAALRASFGAKAADEKRYEAAADGDQDR